MSIPVGGDLGQTLLLMDLGDGIVMERGDCFDVEAGQEEHFIEDIQHPADCMCCGVPMLFPLFLF